MDSLASVWSALSVQRRIFAIGATALVFVVILLLARGAGTKDMSLLFGGLDARAAGDVITNLDQQGVIYEVRGSAIYVPTAQRDILRMNLAAEGLPAAGSQGYELLDQLSGFSTTSQMFDAAYWRAKEGELARTILASPHIRAARVHISTPSGRPFEREQSQSAAVTVTTANGALSAQHVKALQFLVSAAIPRLTPDAVAVIDDDGGLLSEGDNATHTARPDERAEELRLRAERLLAARVGPGNAVVEVAIETITQTEQITERRVDPDSRIAISTDVTESTGASTDSRGGAVTVASNLPDGDANGTDGASSNENSESRTLTNYEVSETERQLLIGPGAVRRLTVAVLVNNLQTTGPNGEVENVARSAEELSALEALVASAVGFDAARGDVLTLRSMPFEAVTPMGTSELGALARAPLDIMRLIQIGVLGAVALILGLFVVRPILAPRRALAAPLEITDTDGAMSVDPPMTMALADGPMDSDVGSGLKIGATDDRDPVARLRQMITEKQPETIQILQDWIDEPTDKAKAS